MRIAYNISVFKNVTMITSSPLPFVIMGRVEVVKRTEEDKKIFSSVLKDKERKIFSRLNFNHRMAFNFSVDSVISLMDTLDDGKTCQNKNE